MQTKQPNDGTGDERVQKGWGCPKCDEQRMDYLVAGEDDDVTCTTCGNKYTLDLTPAKGVG